MTGQNVRSSYNNPRTLIFCFLAAVGGGRSDCIAVESVCGLAVYLAFALHGLAHFSRLSFLSMPVALGATNRTLVTAIVKSAALKPLFFPEGTCDLEGWSERRSRA